MRVSIEHLILCGATKNEKSSRKYISLVCPQEANTHAEARSELEQKLKELEKQSKVDKKELQEQVRTQFHEFQCFCFFCEIGLLKIKFSKFLQT